MRRTKVASHQKMKTYQHRGRWWKWKRFVKVSAKDKYLGSFHIADQLLFPWICTEMDIFNRSFSFLFPNTLSEKRSAKWKMATKQGGSDSTSFSFPIHEGAYLTFSISSTNPISKHNQKFQIKKNDSLFVEGSRVWSWKFCPTQRNYNTIRETETM